LPYKKSAPDIIRAGGVRFGFASSRAEDAVVHFAPVIGPLVGIDKLSTGIDKRWVVLRDQSGPTIQISAAARA
jgi:hypothetical protein